MRTVTGTRPAPARGRSSSATLRACASTTPRRSRYGPLRCGIRRAEERQRRHAERVGEVERPGVAADEERRAAARRARGRRKSSSGSRDASGSSAARRSARRSSPGPHEIDGVRGRARGCRPRASVREALLAPGLVGAARARMKEHEGARLRGEERVGLRARPREQVRRVRRARARRGSPTADSSARLRSTTCARVGPRARRARRRAAAEDPSRRCRRGEARRPGPRPRATSADFQSPWTSIVWSGANARSSRRSARDARAKVAGESGRRRHAFVSATKTRVDVRVAVEQSRERAFDDPPDRRARRARAFSRERQRVDHVAHRGEADDAGASRQRDLMSAAIDGPSSRGPSRRRRSPCGRRTRRRPRARARSRPRSRSPWRGRRGRSAAISSAGESSSKIATASTQSSAATISARSDSGRIGRDGPLARATDRSELIPTASQSPSRRAPSR